jgi:hypothetical protein
MVVFIDAELPSPAAGTTTSPSADAWTGRGARGELGIRAAESSSASQPAAALERVASALMPPWASERSWSILERLPVSKVAGVEVYPTLEGVPAEFRVPGAECGVALVWTTAQ